MTSTDAVAPHIHARTEFDPSAAPILRVAQGERFRVEARSLLTDLSSKAFAEMEEYSGLGIPVTGPILIEGVAAGDLVRIDVLAIDIADRGAMVTMPGRGGFGEPLGLHGHEVNIVDGMVRFTDDVSVPVSPMVGKLGFAPAGESPSSSTVGRFGGNMDCRDIVAGSSVFFTAELDGGLLYAGDLHAAQGDGECSLTGVEVEGVVELVCTTVPSAPVPGPIVVSDGRLIVLGDGEDLDEAATQALDDLMSIVQADRGWTRERTAMFLSIAADVAVSQLVNPRKSIKVSLPLAHLNSNPFELRRDRHV